MLKNNPAKLETTPTTRMADAAADAMAVNCCECVSVFEEMNPTRRKTMEDTWRVVDGYRGHKADGFFAVYDGHGGRGVSEYLQQTLHEHVARELTMDDGRTVEQCIESAYLIADAECPEEAAHCMGSTAVTAILHREGTETLLYTSNIGDSRAVLCHKGRAVRVSKDHKAEDPEEMARIIGQGGFVVHHRVAGVLAVSRSFGDRELKPFVPAAPHTSVTRITSIVDFPFFVLACDGVWDVLDDQEVVDMIVKLPSEDHPRAAELLVREAVDRESCDNITCIVVFL